MRSQGAPRNSASRRPRRTPEAETWSQAVACSQRGKLRTLAEQKRIGLHEDSLDPFLDQNGEGCFQIALGPGIDDQQVQPKRSRGRTYVGYLVWRVSVVGVNHVADIRRVRQHLMQQLQLFWR